jgi:hypothetical protein
MSRRIEWKVFGSRVKGEFLDGDAAAREEGDAGVRFAGLRDASRDMSWIAQTDGVRWPQPIDATKEWVERTTKSSS